MALGFLSAGATDISQRLDHIWSTSLKALYPCSPVILGGTAGTKAGVGEKR